jgi:solute carrier family 40 (iron-regulated transporter), member 1
LLFSGITMTLSILLFASLLGTWVDRGESRLTTLISTISANRISVIAACICWFFIVGLQDLGYHSADAEAMESTVEDPRAGPTGFVLGLKNSLFVLVLFLSVVERLSRTANLFSIERDWVPAMAASDTLSKPDEPPPKFGLTELNAVMSRIDLICKLISPIAMSAFISVAGSVKIGILAVISLNGLTWSAEIWSARYVWKSSDRLQELKKLDTEGEGLDETDDASDTSTGPSNKSAPDTPRPWWQRSSQRVYEAFETTRGGITTWLQDYAVNVHIYFNHAVWLPSMALSILHFSVLNYSATLTTYLNQSAGFSWNILTVAKALSAVAEIGSTFFTPWGVRQTGKIWARRENAMLESGVAPSGDEESGRLLSGREQDNQKDGESAFAPQADMGVAVLGFWSLIQMLISLVSTSATYIQNSVLTPADPRLPRPLVPLLLYTPFPFRISPPTIHPPHTHPPYHHPLQPLRPLDQPPHDATTDPDPRPRYSPLGVRRRGDELREFVWTGALGDYGDLE